ncbi:hypothetical protein B0G77_8528 [Paraburkholderia sp. BL10I2N1]|nr:hypothetical protein B0G77_8528 [Paraburkholderia sp. BL10I2N1]
MPELIGRLDALDRRIDGARLREGFVIRSAATSTWIPAAMRERVRKALLAPPWRCEPSPWRITVRWHVEGTE